MVVAEENRSIGWKICPSATYLKMKIELNYMYEIQFVPSSKNSVGLKKKTVG
jgi:hypothetical protein